MARPSMASSYSASPLRSPRSPGLLAMTLSSLTWNTATAVSTTLPCMHALAASRTPAVLRLLESCAEWAKKALDLGPQGIMFPMIEGPKCARKAVESEDGVKKIEEIAAVDGGGLHPNGALRSEREHGVLVGPWAQESEGSVADGEESRVGSGGAYLAGLQEIYCPTWALTWEYRREHLLNEILSYNADILCLQEVQGDHFEDFLKPEMAEFGYSVIYKKKTKVVYIENGYTTDGCAIFYRANRFKAIIKYEAEFDKIAQPLVETMKPDCRNEGCFQLMKDNIALVVILETVENGIVNDAICVANTHIYANSSFPYTKLFQVVNLIKGLEKISHSQIPAVICGDMNSLPGSEPHEFLISGGVEPNKEGDPLAIYQHLKPFHSMHLASAYSSLLHSGGVEEQQKEKMNTETNEPLFTLFKPTFSSTLDYILYTESRLEVCGLLELLDREGLVGCPLPSLYGRRTTLPSWHVSDLSQVARGNNTQHFLCIHGNRQHQNCRQF
ncbi:hypothetical protein F0562_027763 [Nyssa sinensis]|uniref:Endonuclease/exonuclease/phosphatase domain-containing protein n=1 Tax=Nyssa sinensis TaxID=561372 RepID=A0A5J5B4I0_9ASTE|nr:hypothetical protein F0562_027763 [Nyssa sinensis]